MVAYIHTQACDCAPPPGTVGSPHVITSATHHHVYRALLRTGQLHEAQTATLELLSAEHTAATGEAHTAQPHSESELRVVLAHDAMMHLLRCALQRTDNSQADSVCIGDAHDCMSICIKLQPHPHLHNLCPYAVAGPAATTHGPSPNVCAAHQPLPGCGCSGSVAPANQCMWCLILFCSHVQQQHHAHTHGRHTHGCHTHPHPLQDVHADTAPCAERLAIAAAGQLAEQATLSNTADAQRIRALLWNRGVACFNAHLHQRASMLYRATHAWDGDDARTSIDRCRALALCCMCCNDTQGYVWRLAV